MWTHAGRVYRHLDASLSFDKLHIYVQISFQDTFELVTFAMYLDYEKQNTLQIDNMIVVNVIRWIEVSYIKRFITMYWYLSLIFNTEIYTREL